jgi:diguanylate cyclase (GGDEF)-like protein/PAS domain S-box-containing protein
MGHTLNGRTTSGFFVALLAVALGGVLLHRASAGFEQTQQEGIRAREFLEEIRTFSATIEHADSVQRAFLLSGDESYSSEFQAARRDAELSLKTLSDMASGDDRQSAAVAKLKSLVVERMEALQDGAALRRARGSAVMKPLPLTAASRDQIAAISQTLRILERRQFGLLQAVDAKYAAGVARTGILMVTVFVVQSILLLYLLLQGYRQSAVRSAMALEQLLGNVRLQAVLSTIGEGIYQFDRQERLIQLNQIGEEILGHTFEELRGKPIHAIIHSASPEGPVAPEIAQKLTEVVRTGAPYQNSQDWFQRKDGTFVAVEYNCKPLLLANRIEGGVLSFRDISDRLQVEQALRVSEERYRNLVDKSRGLICTHDLSGRLLSVNQASAEVLGYTPEDMVGKRLSDFLIPGLEKEFESYLRKIAEWGVHRGLMRLLHKNGDEFVWSYSNKIVCEKGQEPYVLGHAHDVTSQIEAERQLRETGEILRTSLENERSLSRIDFLTKIPNRRAFYEATELESQRSRRYRRPLSIVFIDIDNFKDVNDTLGHEMGDDLLRKVAETIRRYTRECNVAARLGGDEFGILLAETGAGGSMAAVSNLRTRLSLLVTTNHWPISFSFGIATFLQPEPSVEDMLRIADELMYEVKRGGKNSIASRVIGQVYDTATSSRELQILRAEGQESPR